MSDRARILIWLPIYIALLIRAWYVLVYRKPSSPKSQMTIHRQSPGYYLDHAEKDAIRCGMRIEANIHRGFTKKTPDGPVTGDYLWFRIREDTRQSTGGCEAAIRLSVEDASQLVGELLNMIHCTLPELSEQDETPE